MVEMNDEVSRLVERALKGISSSHSNNTKSFHSINDSIMKSGKVTSSSNIKTNGIVKEKTWQNDTGKLEKAINNSSLYNPLVSSAPPLKESKPLGKS